MKKVDVYIVEVGVVLPKNHEEYNLYEVVKGYALYDENVVAFTDLDSAKTFAKQYVSEGVDQTYAFIFHGGKANPSDIENNYYEGAYFNGVLTDVLFSLYKNSEVITELFKEVQ